MTPIDGLLTQASLWLTDEVSAQLRTYLESATKDQALVLASELMVLMRCPPREIRDLHFDPDAQSLVYVRTGNDNALHVGLTCHTGKDGYQIVRGFLLNRTIVTFQRRPGTRSPDLITWGREVLKRPHGTIRLDRHLPGVAGEFPYWLEMHGHQRTPGYYEQVHWWDVPGPQMKEVFTIAPSAKGPIYTGVSFRGHTRHIQMGIHMIVTGLTDLGALVPWRDGHVIRIRPTQAEEELFYFSPDHTEILASGYRIWGPLVVRGELAYGIADTEYGAEPILVHWDTGTPLALKSLTQICSPTRRPDLLVVAGLDVDGIGGVWVNSIRVHTGKRVKPNTIQVTPTGTTLRFRPTARSKKGGEPISIDLREHDLAPATDT